MDEARLAEMMEKGEFLIAQNGNGNIVASIYVECEAHADIWACWALIRLNRGRAEEGNGATGRGLHCDGKGAIASLLLYNSARAT